MADRAATRTDGPAEQTNVGETRQGAPAVGQPATEQQEPRKRRVVASAVVELYRELDDGADEVEARNAAERDLVEGNLASFTATGVTRVRSVGVE